jgi:UDP-glucose 4-epimerase
MKAYITGSNGFIGKHLTSRLDDYIAIPHKEISSTKLKPFDNFYFLSAYGNMSHHDEDEKILQANILDLVHILTQMKKEFNSFVFISTSSVRLPRQTMYSRSKKAAEEILLSFAEKYNLPICIIRPFSVTGVGEQEKHLIPTLIRSCLDGEKMNFVPEPVHDFIDVEDVVNGILNLSSHSARGIYDLGTGSQISNQEVLHIVQEVTGKKANINVVRKMRDYDTNEWVSLNYKARGYGWLPKKRLQQSIEEMVEEYKK